MSLSKDKKEKKNKIGHWNPQNILYFSKQVSPWGEYVIIISNFILGPEAHPLIYHIELKDSELLFVKKKVSITFLRNKFEKEKLLLLKIECIILWGHPNTINYAGAGRVLITLIYYV